MIKNIFGWNRTKDLFVKNYLFEFRKDDELANLQESLDKEMHDRQKLVKELRAVQKQNQELKEDLDAEKASRLKIDKARRDLNEELESLKSELDEGIDSAAKNTELRVQREQEIIQVRNELETERSNYEKILSDARHKHTNQLEALQDEIENIKRQKGQAEKAKAALEAENRELSEDLKSSTATKQDSDSKRRRTEANLQEANARLQDAERIKAEQESRIKRLEQGKLKNSFSFFISSYRSKTCSKNLALKKLS